MHLGQLQDVSAHSALRELYKSRPDPDQAVLIATPAKIESRKLQFGSSASGRFPPLVRGSYRPKADVRLLEFADSGEFLAAVCRGLSTACVILTLTMSRPLGNSEAEKLGGFNDFRFFG